MSIWQRGACRAVVARAGCCRVRRSRRRSEPPRSVSARTGAAITARAVGRVADPGCYRLLHDQQLDRRTIAFYPSPAGATESALPLTAWHDIEQANPWVRTLAADVEALLVQKRRDEGDCDGFIVPIDACYDLVGRIRVRWNGLGGGGEVQAEIDRFFVEIAARSRNATAALSGDHETRPLFDKVECMADAVHEGLRIY